jgi:translation initiation factor eIF-2B subunit delta
MPEPVTPQTAPSSTSTQPTASSSKQPGEKQKQTQQPTSTSQTPAAASTAAQGKKKEGKEAAGGKSAKEEKKAKRAAAVAARGGAGGPPAAGPGAPSGGAVGKDGKAKESGKGDRTGQDGTTTAAGIARGDPTAGVVAGTTVATGATSIAAVSTLLFSHLPSSRPPSAIPSTSLHKHLHPLVYRLGLLLSTPSTWTTSSPAFQPQSPPLRGTNARTTALLLTFRQVILDHSWPPREMHRVLPAHLSPMIGFLDGCRPKGVAGGNVIRWLKAEINRVGTDESIRDESEVGGHCYGQKRQWPR